MKKLFTFLFLLTISLVQFDNLGWTQEKNMEINASLPPSPPSNLKGTAIAEYKIKLRWNASVQDLRTTAKYNIYSDNGTRKIDFDKSMATKPTGKVVYASPGYTEMMEIQWISQKLSNGVTYRFVVRAENHAGEEDKNTDAVSIKVIPLGQLSKAGLRRDVSPCWSPDGLTIYYSSDNRMNRRIWKMSSIDGSDKKQLTEEMADNHPDCSPDNSKIVFSSARTGSVKNIWIMNVDGSDQRWLNTVGASLTPTWSPDGQRIAFTLKRGRFGIWTMKPDASKQKALTSAKGGSDNWAPCYSPDGKKIVFASNRTGKTHVWVMDANGSEQKQLTFDPEDEALVANGSSGPVWSPDGKFIAFSHSVDSNDDNKVNWRDGSNIWTMNADGSKILPLTFDNDYMDEEPAWSPDRTKIAFASNRCGNWEIWVTDYLYDSSAFPSANIISPIMNQMIDSAIPIIGTVKDNISVDESSVLSLLSNWKLEYGEGTNPSLFLSIKSSAEQVENDTLAIWNTTGKNGLHTIRLTASDGNDANVQKISVFIQRNKGTTVTKNNKGDSP